MFILLFLTNRILAWLYVLYPVPEVNKGTNGRLFLKQVEQLATVESGMTFALSCRISLHDQSTVCMFIIAYFKTLYINMLVGTSIKQGRARKNYTVTVRI